jgi:YHS domain-containing protein
VSSAIDEIDPVCGRDVDRHEAVATIRYGDFTYFFDTFECAEKFRRDPERYTRAPETG